MTEPLTPGPNPLPHIGVVAPEFPPDLGGVENYAQGYVEALTRLGYPVTVFTVRHAQGELSLPRVQIEPALRLRRVLDRRLLKTPGIQAWHAMNAAYAWIAEETQAPVVVSVHGNDFLHAYMPVSAPAPYRLPLFWRWETPLRRLEGVWQGATSRHIHRWLPQARQVLANSRYTERVLLQRIPALRGRTQAAKVGVDPYFLTAPLPARPPHEGPWRLLTIARLTEPRKNVGRVIQALAGLGEHFDFHYTVVGEGPERAPIEALSRDLGLGDRVQFTGPLPRPELRDQLLRADLFVLTSSILPTSHEGFGLVYLEAAACGTPSLAARLAGAVEAIDEGRTGLFVDQPEVDQIGAALARVMSGEVRFDPDQCRAFARTFTWEKVVEKAAPFYIQSSARHSIPK